MKFRCDRSFEHSGVCGYTKGNVYGITPETAETLIALDSKRTAGAMEYFTPVDEEASAFMKTRADKPAGKNGSPTKPPTKAELTAEAEALGITLKGKETNTEIIELIAAKKAPAGQGGGGTGGGAAQ